MTSRVRELRAPIYCTKAEKWQRIMEYENRRTREAAERALVAERRAAMEQSLTGPPVEAVPAPSEPTAQERAQHELTHLSSSPLVCS